PWSLPLPFGHESTARPLGPGRRTAILSPAFWTRENPMSATPTLERAVSRWQIVALALNNVVGSGVYLLPAAAAAAMGARSLWAVLAAGFAVLLVVLCFAEAASRFDRAGGAYLYTRVAFGDLVGFEVGWVTWLSSIAASAALSAGFAQA